MSFRNFYLLNKIDKINQYIKNFLSFIADLTFHDFCTGLWNISPLKKARVKGVNKCENQKAEHMVHGFYTRSWGLSHDYSCTHSEHTLTSHPSMFLCSSFMITAADRKAPDFLFWALVNLSLIHRVKVILKSLFGAGMNQLWHEWLKRLATPLDGILLVHCR